MTIQYAQTHRNHLHHLVLRRHSVLLDRAHAVGAPDPSCQTRRKAPKTRRKPPAAASCVKLRELKLKRESEQTRARTRKLGRPTPALEHPTDDKFCWSGGGNSHRLSKPSFIFSM